MPFTLFNDTGHSRGVWPAPARHKTDPAEDKVTCFCEIHIQFVGLYNKSTMTYIVY
jgi:hypothetical protein